MNSIGLLQFALSGTKFEHEFELSFLSKLSDDSMWFCGSNLCKIE